MMLATLYREITVKIVKRFKMSLKSVTLSSTKIVSIISWKVLLYMTLFLGTILCAHFGTEQYKIYLTQLILEHSIKAVLDVYEEHHNYGEGKNLVPALIWYGALDERYLSSEGKFYHPYGGEITIQKAPLEMNSLFGVTFHGLSSSDCAYLENLEYNSTLVLAPQNCSTESSITWFYSSAAIN